MNITKHKWTKTLWMSLVILFSSPLFADGNTVYEDAEDGETTGWRVYDKTPAGAAINNVFDNNKNSQVIELTGSGKSNGYILGSWSGNTAWNNTTQKNIQWSMKYRENFSIYISTQTTKGHRYLYYTNANSDRGLVGGNKSYVHHGLGSDAIDGSWKAFNRDLDVDLKEFEPDNTILSINAFLVRGSGMLDDIALSDVKSIVYEDAEDGETTGWRVYDKTPAGAAISNVFDNDKNSQVIELAGSGKSNGYILGSWSGSAAWNNTTQKNIQWGMKYREDFSIFISTQTIKGHRYLYYTNANNDRGLVGGNKSYVHHGLGSDAIDGTWKTFHRDLDVDLKEFEPDNTILSINAFLVRGSGRLDDVALSGVENKTISWTSIGPGGGGWISSITVANDENNTVYAACDVGGIYKSTNHGQTWEIKNKGLSMYYVQDIAYDPNNTTTLYAATRGGVFKSTNGGDSWAIKRTGFPSEAEFKFSAPVSDIVVDPNNPNIIYAGIGVPRSGYDPDSSYWEKDEAGNPIQGTIYKSTNYGESWKKVNTGINSSAMIYSLAIDPINSNILYTATSKGVYETNTAGEAWTPKNTGLPHQLAMTLVIDPSNTNTLYVTLWAEPESSSWQGGVYKSVNGGNWVAKNTGLPQAMSKKLGFTSNYPQLVIDKSNPQTLYLGNTPWTPNPGIYKTINGGESWKWVSIDNPDEGNANVNTGWITEHGISVKSLAIDPLNPGRLYFGTSVHLITTDDAGLTWKQTYSESKENGYWKGNGLETTVVAAIAVDPHNPKNIYAGYWDMGFLKSTDGGISFKRISNGFLDDQTGVDHSHNTFAIIIDPNDTSIIYAASGWWEKNEGAVYKSINYGESWTRLGTGLPGDAQVWSIALDENSPVDSRTLYAASYGKGIYKTTNGGLSWDPINNGLGVRGNLQVRKILVDPNNSDVLYAGIEAKQIEIGETNSTVQGGLFKSTNGGKLWTRIDSSSPQITVLDIAISPTDSQTVYTTVRSEYDHDKGESFVGGVYKSTNGGNSWSRKNDGFGGEDNLNTVSIEISPANSNTLYATTSDSPFHDQSSGRGVFKSTDAGSSWKQVSSKSNILSYETITFDPSNPSVLYAGSSGNGILKGIDHE